MLTWHNDNGDGIPEDEIWIKVGGDHGGGSFKLALHVCNLKKPNAPCNTICCLVFEAMDRRDNLETVLEVITEQLKIMKSRTWR